MSGPFHSFRCAKLAITRNFGVRHWTARFMCRSGGSQCYWRMDQAFGPRLPVPNVAFWCCLNGQETRSKLQPASVQNLGLATATHNATEGRTSLRPAAACAERGLKLQPSNSQNLGLATAKQCYWRTDQAFGPQLPVPNVAFLCFLNGQETTSSKLQPSSFQNLGLATAKHHGTEGRIVPSANGCLCLTLLSERTRNYSSSLWYLVASGIVLSGFLASCAGPCFLLVLHGLASCFLAASGSFWHLAF